MKPQRTLFAYLWVSPVTVFGMFFALLAYAFGAKMKWRYGVLEVAGHTRTHWLNKLTTRYEAITLGHVILGRKHGVLKTYRSHEHVHVRQYERWGVLFPLLYVLASLLALLRGKHFYWDNVFEVEARKKSAD
ncbi:MAG TPA: signal peptide prediction [Burkholderiaceae bacterium]|nr:signal peptide prediction [Burkholderiaceae bacterium]